MAFGLVTDTATIALAARGNEVAQVVSAIKLNTVGASTWTHIGKVLDRKEREKQADEGA